MIRRIDRVRMDPVLADLPILWRMLRGRPTLDTQAASLEAFYAPQAEAYDRFRERLLTGRDELVQDLVARLPVTGGVLVELGAGTGRNLVRFGDRLARFDAVHAVDLCPSLLAVARRRAAERRWRNVVISEADATLWQPPQPVDAVLMSYSLSMMPPWREILAQVRTMLRPGGWLALVDFHVPGAGGWIDRRFWPWWFAHDGVWLRVGLLSALSEVGAVESTALRSRPPYLPITVPVVRALVRRTDDP